MGTGEDLSGASPVAGGRAVPRAAPSPAPSPPSVPVPVPRRPRPAPDDAVYYGLRVTAGYAWRLVVVAVAVYLVFVVLGTLAFVAVAVFAGLVITALLRPVVDLLGRAVPRGVAVLLSLLLTLLALGGVVTFIANSVAGQSARLTVQFGHGLADLEQSLAGAPFHLRAVDVGRLGEQARTWVTANTASLAGQALGGAGVAVELLTGLALAVFCSVFFLASGERIWAWVSVQLRRRAPPLGRGGTGGLGDVRRLHPRGRRHRRVERRPGGCGLLLLRVPLALPLALLVFFAAFVPLVGAPIALAVATLVALAARGPLVAILVVVLTVVIGQVEGHILHPLVMSRAVNLHPLAVALSVASGTVLAGVIGAVVAVPLVAVAWTVWSALRAGPPLRPPLRRPARRRVRPGTPSPEDEPTRFLAVRCPGADGEDLMESQRIADRYLVLRAIGRGGMGVVWLCRDEVLGREVAVKQIGGLPGEPEVETMRAMREARSAAALNHPNVVAVYDVVNHDGRPWLVMEYVDGQTLAEILAVEGRLPPQQVAGIGALLADALDRAHERGIVHRDVKPGNVLVDRGGRPKVSDFGIARGHGDDQLTQTGFVSGTPGYLSPELARGGDPDPASDVWALGATLVRRGGGPGAVREPVQPAGAAARDRHRAARVRCSTPGAPGAGDRRDDGPGPGPPLGHGHRRRAPGRDLPRRHLPAGGHAASPPRRATAPSC